MSYDLSDLDANAATCTSSLGISITYRLQNITPRVLRELGVLDNASIRDLQANTDAVVDSVHALVIAWDLTDRARYGEDVPVPLTQEALADVRIEVLGDVMHAIFKDARLGESTGTVSAPTSRASSARKAGRSSRRRG